MITLLLHTNVSRYQEVEVLLDITLKDLDEPTEEIRAVLKEAKTLNRKVAGILRQLGGNTFITYDPANQAQLEVSLIEALATPKADIHVTQESGGYGKWQKY